MLSFGIVGFVGFDVVKLTKHFVRGYMDNIVLQ